MPLPAAVRGGMRRNARRRREMQQNGASCGHLLRKNVCLQSSGGKSSGLGINY
jgi:hypothetical protein